MAPTLVVTTPTKSTACGGWSTPLARNDLRTSPLAHCEATHLLWTHWVHNPWPQTTTTTMTTTITLTNLIPLLSPFFLSHRKSVPLGILITCGPHLGPQQNAWTRLKPGDIGRHRETKDPNTGSIDSGPRDWRCARWARPLEHRVEGNHPGRGHRKWDETGNWMRLTRSRCGCERI